MSIITNLNKVFLVLLTFSVLTSCSGQNSNSKVKSDLKQSFIKDYNSQVCNDLDDKGYQILIKDTPIGNPSICIVQVNESYVCNENLLFTTEELGAISAEKDNVSLICRKGKVVINQEYGGGSSQGTYHLEISLAEKPIIDSVSVSEKIFLEEEVKVISKGEKTRILFNENSDVASKFKSLSKALYSSKHDFILNYLENKSMEKYQVWSIESTRLLEDVHIEEKHLEQVNTIAFRLEQLGNFEESILLLERILSKFPNRVGANLNLADCYYALDNIENSKEYYQKYLALIKKQKKDTTKIPQRVYDRID